MSWNQEWITEEEMSPYSRVSENYEDSGELNMYDFWEDYKREEYETRNK